MMHIKKDGLYCGLGLYKTDESYYETYYGNDSGFKLVVIQVFIMDGHIIKP